MIGIEYMKLRSLTKVAILLACIVGINHANASLEETILTDSKWVVDVEIVFPPGVGTLFIQNGKVDTDTDSGDRFFPYCTINLEKQLRHALVVEKNSDLLITNVSYRDESVHTTAYIFTTILRIDAPDYPQITSIECSYWGDQTDNFMSIFDMKRALANVMSFKKK